MKPADMTLLELRHTVRGFVEADLLPNEPKLGPDGTLDAEVWRGLQDKGRQLGLWQYDVPKEYGGQGLNLEACCVVAEELNKTKAVPFRHNDLFGPKIGPILYSLNDKQKDKYLYPVLEGKKKACFAQSEPDAGSDPASLSTAAMRDGNEFVLTGRKRWIGGAGVSDFAQVVCRTESGDGHSGLSVLLVDMDSPGVELVRTWPTMMGDSPWEVAFRDVRVPRENLVGSEGEGFRLAQQWLTRNRITNHGARSVGIAQRALDMSMDRANARSTFGELLANRQAVQFMIVDSAMELEGARLMVYDAARRFDRGEDVRNASYMAKIIATEVGGRVVDRAIQIHGALGLSTDLPLEHFYRQMRSIRITEGVTEVLRWRLARNLLRERAKAND